jgi:hypothetical protein
VGLGHSYVDEKAKYLEYSTTPCSKLTGYSAEKEAIKSPRPLCQRGSLNGNSIARPVIEIRKIALSPDPHFLVR